VIGTRSPFESSSDVGSARGRTTLEMPSASSLEGRAFRTVDDCCNTSTTRAVLYVTVMPKWPDPHFRDIEYLAKGVAQDVPPVLPVCRQQLLFDLELSDT